MQRSLRDARIRSKLGLILLIPLVATIALAGVRLLDGGRRAREADLVQSLAAVSVEAATVAHDVHRERIQAARLVTDPGRDAAAFTVQADRLDDAVTGYRTARGRLGSVPDLVADRLAVIDQHLAELDSLRRQVQSDPPLAVPAVILRYGVIVTDVLAYQDAVAGAIEDPGLSEEFRAAAALSAAKVHAADAQAFAQVTAGGPGSEEQLGALLAAQTGQREAFLTFQQAASPDQQARVDAVITGGSVAFTASGAITPQPAAGSGPAISRTSYSGMVSSTRWVEHQLYELLLASAGELRGSVFRRVLLESAAVLVTLLVTVTVAVLLARMLAASLGRLRQHALAVAERELPQAVAQLADPSTLGEHTPGQLAGQVREPAELRSRDEIGQVAQSFGVVHRAAVRVAAEQAALRTSVSAMFLSLARRSQTLVDRLIRQLDQVERDEQDPRRLAELFMLDHLATRMRRNDENLLTLAGADSSPPRDEDAPVVDVLRAAQSEIEHYDRIEFGTVDSDVSVVAGAVNDVVRLVAELFDNATRFSPPDAPVVCEARRLGDQVVIQVEDRGVGIAADQVQRINAWLAAPPALEVTTFRKMGLAVVSRLANRHGIRVELRCDPSLGTVAYVALPRDVLMLPFSRRRRAVVPPPPIPQPAPAPPPPAPRSGTVVRHAANRRQPVPDTSARPVAGRPPYELTAAPEPLAPEHTVELPIFQEIEAVWFRDGDGPPDLDSTTPEPTGAPGEEWSTAADTGWRAAARAATPTPAGATPSGLPKRTPQAQLVPGSVDSVVEPAPGTLQPRRSPEEVRGLLSAYHRGVQRGRESGSR